MRRARLLLVLVLFILTTLPLQSGSAGFDVQAANPQRQAEALLARLTPEEKVGQLFLVTFAGLDVAAGTPIVDLVTKYHVGGVVLSAANDNFIGPDNALSEAYRVNTTLQTRVWEVNDAAQAGGMAETPLPSRYVPLLIGLSQEGDQYPGDQLLNGMTPLPSLMSVGATWDVDLARRVGSAQAAELSSLGFNLLLGPSLDVLYSPPAEGGEDMGTRSFGGDPYWVGVMGQSFIQGLHEGSGGRLAVIAKHFPGRGASDRSPETEVATVRKSLEQLKQVELAPFFSVTGLAPEAAKTTDGLLVSHIRYQGFQDNIRATTSPVSFDRKALEQILALPQLDTWRKNGGVIVSDDLGSPALRRFYESAGQVFDARQVARNAFLAGSDLLYLNNFVAEGDPDAYTTIIRTISLFTAKYREDPAFAERVDASVLRILTMKYRLYPNFTLDSILPADQERLNTIGQSTQLSFEVARKAAGLISPEQEDLDTLLPRPPGLNDRIVFITDNRPWRQCTRCPEQVTLAVDAMQNAVMRLYGPQAGGQVFASRLVSYSTTDLNNMLNGTQAEITQLEQDLRQAGWIVFGLLNQDSSRPESRAVTRFLSERPDLFRNKRLIAFTFSAPYYLDATDISKFTAYYGLYSKVPAFVDVAARILFQELSPVSSPPVSVPGVGYDLITATSPDPTQVISLFLDTLEPLPPGTTPQATLEPTPVPVFNIGDALPLRTGVILDHNGLAVPDGTVVDFLFTAGGDTGTVQQIETTTLAGVARATYRIQTPGLLEVRVISNPAVTSQILRMDVSEAGGVITPISPTQAPTETPMPTPSATPTVTPTATPVVLPPARPGTFSDWLLAMLLIWSASGVVYVFGQMRFSQRWGFRWAMLTALGGLLAYFYLAMTRMVNEDAAREISTGQIITITGLGIIAGLLIGVAWRRWMQARARSQPERHITGPKSPAG